MSYKVRDYLRHTFATLALQNGVDVKTVSSMLGHYDAGFTLRTYTHATRQKQDARHLSKSAFETVLSGWDGVKRPVEDAVLRNLRLENLRRAIAGLDVQGQNLLSLRYGEELTMEEIGQIYGISKMAASKRLKKLYQKLEDSVL